MRRRLTSAWTDTHAPLVATAVCLLLLGVLAGVAADGAAQVIWATVAVTGAVFAGAILLDAFGGLILGLVATAVITALHQYLPDAHPVPFVVQATTFALLLLLGISSGTAADRIRRGRRIAERRSSQPLETVPGSIGMMTAADAETALEQERVRAELHDRPLTVAAIEIKLTDDDLGPEERRRARRAVARSLETELRVTDIVYADEGGRFGAILPESSATAARDVLESALMVAREATFADRTRGGRRTVGDVADLSFAVSEVSAGAQVVPLAEAATAPTRRRARRRPRSTEPVEAV